MTSAAAPAVRTRVDDGIATVTMERPPLNVLTTAMLGELEAAIRELAAAPELRLITLRGAGRVFSAGVDVGEHIGEALGPMLDAFAGASLALMDCEVPALAVVQGAALGGACELVALCDLAIAADDAKLGTPEISLGVVPPVAAVAFPSLVGAQRARALVLTGEPITGSDAAAWGLVWRSVPATALEAEVAATQQRFRSLSAASLRLAKRTFRVTGLAPTPSQAVLAADAEQRRTLPDLRDADEGLRAFVAKRQPRWEHR